MKLTGKQAQEIMEKMERASIDEVLTEQWAEGYVSGLVDALSTLGISTLDLQIAADEQDMVDEIEEELEEIFTEDAETIIVIVEETEEETDEECDCPNCFAQANEDAEREILFQDEALMAAQTLLGLINQLSKQNK